MSPSPPPAPGPRPTTRPRRSRTAALVAVALAAGLLTVACGIDTETVQGGPIETPTTLPSSERPTIPQTSTTTTTTQPAIDEQGIRAVIANVQSFWAKTLPALYSRPYEPVPDSSIIAGTTSAEYPVCDSHQITYDDVEGNAFAANCPEGTVVVWDDQQLIPDLDQRFGPIGAAIVLAHEWGHIAQFEGGVDASTIITEQQADCFAGAWLAGLVDEPGPLRQVAEANPLDSSLSAIIEFRDDPGSSPTDPGAHGTGFDRVRALQEGFDKGAAYCKDYTTKAPPLIDLPFLSEDDVVNGGNLPLTDLVPVVVDDLNGFYQQVVPDFAGATSDDVLEDQATMDTLQGLSDRIGDNGAGLLLGMVWAQFAQKQVGADKGRDELGQTLQQACMAGGWLANVYNDSANEDRDLKLSPGDLDEAIQALIDLGTSNGTDRDTGGGLFRLVASLRQGVVDGFDSCKLEG